MRPVHSTAVRFAPARRAIYFLFLALGLSACGAGTVASDASTDADASGGETGVSNAPSLVGRWKSDCLPSQNNQSITLAFDIAATTWSLDYVTYGDATCTAPFVTAHITGPYELMAPSPTVSGAWNARFAFDTKTLTPHGSAAVGYLSGLTDCGTGSFQDGVATDVYTNGCAALGQYPRAMCGQDYDLVSLTGDDLRFGDRPADNNMCTEDRRPAALAQFAVHRQP